jgi:uncharacterized protein (DUF4415 family)
VRTLEELVFEWDEESKAGINFRKHSVHMPEAIPVFDDPHSITITDDESDPRGPIYHARRGCAGPFACGRLYLAWRKHTDHFRATRRAAGTRTVRGRTMKDHYDFSKGKRGRVLPPESEPEGKVRITIRLDQDIVDRFLEMAEQSGGVTGYQTLINRALREYLEGKAPRLEHTLRRIIREELKSSAA